jgi:hypothetical protein
MTVIVIYASLVLAAFLPREAKDWGFFCPRGTISFACALLSSFALPWSGAPVIHSAGIGSWPWFPLTASAVIFLQTVQPEASRDIAGKVFLIAAVTVSTLSMSRFMSSSGVPGALLSIEGLSMAARLYGPGKLGATAAAALSMIAAGLFFSFVSFAAVCRRSAAFSILSFSFSGFWAITFIPLDLSGLARTPRDAAVLAPALLFAASCAIRVIFMRSSGAGRGWSWLAQNRPDERKRSALASLAKFLPFVVTASGSFILASL